MTPSGRLPKIKRVLPAQSFDPARIIDAVILDHEQRRSPGGELVSVKGTRFAAAAPAPLHLRMGDALELEAGGLIEVVAEAESLVEVRAADASVLARIAWNLGDRHVPVQLFANRIRLRRAPSLEALIASLGGRMVTIEAPFDPEGGAYVEPARGHTHSHDRHPHAHGPRIRGSAEHKRSTA